MDTFTSANSKLTVVPVPPSTFKVSFQSDNLAEVNDIILKRSDFTKLKQKVKSAQTKLPTVPTGHNEDMGSLNFADHKIIMTSADNQNGKRVIVTGVDGGSRASVLAAGAKVDELLQFLTKFSTP